MSNQHDSSAYNASPNYSAGGFLNPVGYDPPELPHRSAPVAVVDWREETESVANIVEEEAQPEPVEEEPPEDRPVIGEDGTLETDLQMGKLFMPTSGTLFLCFRCGRELENRTEVRDLPEGAGQLVCPGRCIIVTYPQGLAREIAHNLVEDNLGPCPRGHSNCWVQTQKKGRRVTVMCFGTSPRSPKATCLEERKYWIGKPPGLPATTKSLDKKMAVLSCLDHAERPLHYREVAERTGIKKELVARKLSYNAGGPKGQAHSRRKGAPHVEQAGVLYDAATDRFVVAWQITPAGRIWLRYRQQAKEVGSAQT